VSIMWLNPDFFPADECERVNRQPSTDPITGAAPPSARAPLPARLPQQLDLDGGLHDLAPEHEALRLFDSAPQIRGQIALDTDELTRDDVRAVACPSCHAPAGSPCKRPSGHRAMNPHAPRVRAAEAAR
jgi:hypothetical protein